MPSSVSELLASAGLAPAGALRWGRPVPESGPGVYVIALSEDAEDLNTSLPSAPLSAAALQHLLDVRPELRIDAFGQPRAHSLSACRASGWPTSPWFISGWRARP